MKRIALGIGLLFCLGSAQAGTRAQVWRLERANPIAGHAVEVLGAPRVIDQSGRKSLCFDGKQDGLFVPVNPIEGWRAFTIEVLLRPDGDGPPEQRFLHIQDEAEHRVLIETRVADDAWALDTFLRTTDEQKLTLLDRAQTNPTDRWYWAALVYDGKTLSHYVNAQKQLAGEVAFPPMGPGRISLGVRQNRIHWFKGCIAEVRFTPRALPTKKLRRAP